MRHRFSCVLPYNLSIIYPDNVLASIVRYNVDKCHIENIMAAVAQDPLKQQRVLTRRTLKEELLRCIHSYNLLHYHITVAHTINYAESKCYLVRTRLLHEPVFSQIPVWDSRLWR